MKKDEVSLKAKFIRKMISIATSDHIIGPALKIGRAHV